MMFFKKTVILSAKSNKLCIIFAVPDPFAFDRIQETCPIVSVDMTYQVTVAPNDINNRYCVGDQTSIAQLLSSRNKFSINMCPEAMQSAGLSSSGSGTYGEHIHKKLFFEFFFSPATILY